MDKKNVKHLSNLFQTSNYKSAESILALIDKRHSSLKEILQRATIPDHLIGLSEGAALLRVLIPSDIDSILNLGIYRSFTTGDMSLLNNAIYSYNRLSCNKCSPSLSAADHSIYFRNVIECFAGNDISLIDRVFAEEKGLTSNGLRLFTVGANLVISMLHQRNDWLDESLVAANIFLIQKNGDFDKAIINYLIAVATSKAEVANLNLSHACELYQKAKWIHDFKSPYLKIFGIFIHGLYNLGHYFLKPHDFNLIEEPNHSVFWKGLTEYQKVSNFKLGERFFELEGNLQILNFIYK